MNWSVSWKMVPYPRPKLSYTLSRHTFRAAHTNKVHMLVADLPPAIYHYAPVKQQWNWKLALPFQIKKALLSRLLQDVQMEKNIWKETQQKKMRSMLRSEPEKFVDEILKCDHWGNSAVRFSCGAVYYAVQGDSELQHADKMVWCNHLNEW